METPLEKKTKYQTIREDPVKWQIHLEQRRQYVNANREKIYERNRQWQKDNHEAYKECMRRNYLKNKDRLKNDRIKKRELENAARVEKFKSELLCKIL